MKPAQILFEKILLSSTVSNEQLIRCSEKRRSLFDNIFHNKGLYTKGKEYYAEFVQLLDNVDNTMVKIQPLFQWNNIGSSCWNYEKLNIEDLLVKECFKKAQDATDLKLKRNYFKESIQYGMKALDTLRNYIWEDVSLKSLPIFQDRYHIYNICKSASQYYKTMNDYSVQQNNKDNTICIKHAFEFMDIANHVWKSDDKDKSEWTILKAYYLWNIAKSLEDDKCGEKIALLKDIVPIKEIPEKIKSEYKIWKQQNEQVYYGAEETDHKIIFSSLKDLFQTLEDAVGQD